MRRQIGCRGLVRFLTIQQWIDLVDSTIHNYWGQEVQNMLLYEYWHDSLPRIPVKFDVLFQYIDGPTRWWRQRSIKNEDSSDGLPFMAVEKWRCGNLNLLLWFVRLVIIFCHFLIPSLSKETRSSCIEYPAVTISPLMMIFLLLPQLVDGISVPVEVIMGSVWVPHQILWFSLTKTEGRSVDVDVFRSFGRNFTNIAICWVADPSSDSLGCV